MKGKHIATFTMILLMIVGLFISVDYQLQWIVISLLILATIGLGWTNTKTKRNTNSQSHPQ